MRLRLVALALMAGVLVGGCASSARAPEPASAPQQPTPPQPAQTPQPAPPTPPPAPLVAFSDRQIMLGGEFLTVMPEGINPLGFDALVLAGAGMDTATITFERCPKAIPVDQGCIGNHRAPKGTAPITLAGSPATTYVVSYSQPSAANDKRTWTEWYTLLRLSSGDRVAIAAHVVDGSGFEARLEAAYHALLARVHGI